MEGEVTADLLVYVSGMVRRRIDFSLTIVMDRLLEMAMKGIDAEHPADFYLRPTVALEQVFVAFSAGWNQFLSEYFSESQEVLMKRKIDPMTLFDRWKVDPDYGLLQLDADHPLAEKLHELHEALSEEVLADDDYKVRLPMCWKDILLSLFTRGWNASRQAMGARG